MTRGERRTRNGQVLTVEVTPVSRPRTSPVSGSLNGDWLCGWCLNTVANDADRFQYNGQDQFNFANPAGARFEIMTFCQAEGCREIGARTHEHTWFPEYAWSFCYCARCKQHLGWFYTGPFRFVALIMEHIVHASCIRN